jgi:hypothetical protein
MEKAKLPEIRYPVLNTGRCLAGRALSVANALGLYTILYGVSQLTFSPASLLLTPADL